MERLHNRLGKLSISDDYPFHMPGHKRNIVENFPLYYGMDTTEVEGFDNLAAPTDIIKEEEIIAAKVFNAEESFLLVNGSTCGILATIFTCCKPNNKIVFARNSHKSAYNALSIRGLDAKYIYPTLSEYGSIALSISPKDVEDAIINEENIKAVFITSPTYEGIISDIEQICKVAHSFHIPVIVDEAHGAHMGIWGTELNQKSAIQCGADLVIQSLHKTLPALTQTAIIHKQGKFVDSKTLQMNINIFQSSSPSYILLDSITECIHYCEKNKNNLFKCYIEKIQKFYKFTENLKNIKILKKLDFPLCFRKDIGKIIIYVGNTNLNGQELSDILREKYHLIMEMASFEYVIAMTSIMDTENGFDRLANALIEIDSAIYKKEGYIASDLPINVIKFKIGNAMQMNTESVELENSIGRISAEFCYLYPPGIPYIVPGEIISKEAIDLIKRAKDTGLIVQGIEDINEKYIKIINVNGEEE